MVSRRDLIEESRRESRRKVLADIQVGQVRPGVVKNITDFGAFVDLDGIDGLLHVTDMTWGRINHPSEQLNHLLRHKPQQPFQVPNIVILLVSQAKLGYLKQNKR